MADCYSFASRVVLSVSGDGAARRHFNREYGPVATDPKAEPCVEAKFGSLAGAAGSVIAGGHKTMRWRMVVSDPSEKPLRLWVQTSGLPRGYALSLVQGYFLEPLLSVAATRSGAVLLPAASFVVDGKAVMVEGLSGSGKTSLSAYALAVHRPLLGDDQVIVTADGSCRPFPRSLRIYPDIRHRSPAVYGALSGMIRAKLEIRRIAQTLSRGWLAPSLALPESALGQVSLPDPAPLGQIVLLKRSPAPGELKIERTTTGEAIEFGLEALREQRRMLADVSQGWREALAHLERNEARLLGRAFACVIVSRITVPTPLDGGVAKLAEHLGLPTRDLQREVAT